MELYGRHGSHGHGCPNLTPLEIYIRFHVFTCRILGEPFATLPPSHRPTHRGALGLRGAPPGSAPMRYLRTHAGQGRADRQDRGQGGRQKTHFAKSRLWPGRRWYLARELHSLMGKRGNRPGGRTLTELCTVYKSRWKKRTLGRNRHHKRRCP